MKKHLVCFRITNVYKNGLKQTAVEALPTYGSLCLLSDRSSNTKYSNFQERNQR